MPCEQSATPNANERRRHTRYPCPLPIQVTSLTLAFPLYGETSDVSLSGCYVNTLMPLPKDLQVNVRITVDNTEISTAACIRTCDQGVGNGIEFRETNADFCQVLQAKLQAIQQAPEERQAS